MPRKQLTFVDDGIVLSLKVTPLEYELYCLLASKPFRYYSHSEIYKRIWKQDCYVDYGKLCQVRNVLVMLRQSLGGIGIRSQVVSRKGHGTALRRRAD